MSFRLTGYYLDITKLPLTQRRIVNGQREEIPTTIGDVYKSLAERRFGEVEDCTTEIVVKTDSEELTFIGSYFNERMLYEMLRLGQEGEAPLAACWYWYASEVDLEAPGEFHRFFIEFNDRIVRECVVVGDCPGNGFDSSVFEARDNSSPELEAETRYWYRKFYTKTKTGQLMVLRKDRPKLYDYRSAWGPDIVPALLKKIHFLLWALVVIGILLLIRLWK